jgi:hypothetical protein
MNQKGVDAMANVWKLPEARISVINRKKPRIPVGLSEERTHA